MKKEEFRCKHSIGSGGGMFQCKLTHNACPYQRWCHIKRLFEFKPDAQSKCKNFIY